MNSDSIRLTWAGAMIGVLALSATVFARTHPPARTAASELPAPALEAVATGGAELYFSGDREERDGEAVPVLAEQRAGPFAVALRITEPPAGERLYLCDRAGCPLEELEPDSSGDALLGPLMPGEYGLVAGGEEIGSFRLLENAALEAATGQLWTDGELLHLERFRPGAVRLELRLPAPGYYTLQLFDRDGRSWSRDLYIPRSALPETGGVYFRTAELRGLPPGLYTLVRRKTPLAQTEVQAGETAVLTLTLDK